MKKRQLLPLIVALGLLLGSAQALAQSDPKPDKDKKKTEKPDPNKGESTDPYSVYSTGRLEEVYIDEEFGIYRQRPYKGMVPGRNEKKSTEDEAAVVPPEPPKNLLIPRIGFEQMELFSRIFVAVNKPVTPWIYDNFATADANPGTPYQIVIEVAGAKIPRRTDRLPLETLRFNTPVLKVQGVHYKGGSRVIVTLKRKARYLPSQGENVLYLDIER